MDLTRIILGQIVTEKAERQKAGRIYTLRVHPRASKVDVKNALRQHYGVDAEGISMMHLRAKKRDIGRGKSIEKRSQSKRAIVLLSKDSKALDLSSLTA
ncbi:MAG TPA: 50S ribosomal protein L23 [Candidatus Peribacterales bacterium]|nr:50S ribosomal protein L23 [Candidatus Peribacterales bacterium]